MSQKIKLSMYKLYDHTKTYHPLKRKKIKFHKLKFVINGNVCDLSKAIKTLKEGGSDILSKRYSINKSEFARQNNWSNEEEIINWLDSINIKIKRINSFQFLLKNKVYSFNSVVIFANKKRLELGLSPFYIEGITEY
ncbi:MAG: hypothetical protein LBE95_03465 [Holosporaceae bacterium]|nr:hypothetical protein [Holosporaceae bacterium]